MRLALVVIEENAWRTVHLRYDHALGAVYNERAVIGHERHVAHVNVLFLDVLDRLRARILVDIEHDQAQRHLERRSIGQIALTAFVNVEFWSFEFVLDEFEHGSTREIRNRENRLEYSLQTFIQTPALGLFHHQKLIVGSFLNLDEVRHLCDFRNLTEKLAYAPTTIERMGLSHRRSSSLCQKLACFLKPLHAAP